jgi:hypothetical protein
LESFWEYEHCKVHLTFNQQFFAFYILAEDNTVQLGHFFHVEEVGNSEILIGFEGSEGLKIR